jgi:Trk-type K+ transport system membrane component
VGIGGQHATHERPRARSIPGTLLMMFSLTMLLGRLGLFTLLLLFRVVLSRT